MLLEHGARADARSRRGSTARHFAAQQDNQAVLELLMAGAEPSAVNSPGFRSRTPLHLALLSHGNPEIVKVRTGSLWVQGQGGIRPLAAASEHGDDLGTSHMRRLLWGVLLCERILFVLLQVLINAGANTSAPNRALHGITPLHLAAHHGR